MNRRGSNADNDITAALKPSVKLIREGETALLIGSITFAPITRPIMIRIIAVTFAKLN